MEPLSVYIPVDRRHALAQATSLPDQTQGAALFADIAGFTALTEALARKLGVQRGAEVVTHHLNLVYGAIITEVHRYGGSVISFSGDAITCWFDDQLPAVWQGDWNSGHDALSAGTLRAVACALAMQTAMAPLVTVTVPSDTSITLAIKVAIAAGPVQRLVVGDPQIQLIDVLVGTTLNQLAVAERLARPGEVVLAVQRPIDLEDSVHVVEYRSDLASNTHVAVLGALKRGVAPAPWPPIPDSELSDDPVRPWLLPPIYERLRRGQGQFLPELRPVVALFLRFPERDYDHDKTAPVKLDHYIRWVQRTLVSYDAYVIQLTIGDKGSFLYVPFGAPLAHENDPVRAVSAALALQKPPAELTSPDTAQIGISRGRMRVGSYGSQERYTYGAIGDATNLAARLMQAALPGQILATPNIVEATASRFAWSKQAALQVKGKSTPVPIFVLETPYERPTMRLSEPDYALPLVGREAEMAQVEAKLSLTRQGQGQIVALTGEAGIGKSRLVAESLRRARMYGFELYGGECESHGVNTPYQVWRSIWQSFFRLDPTASIDEQIATLADQLSSVDPALLTRLPLLGAALNLPIPDNELTASLDAKLRKESLEALLVDCLKQRASQVQLQPLAAPAHALSTGTSQPRPLLFILEDCHWLDPLSQDLLEAIGRVVVGLPVALILTYRSPAAGPSMGSGVTQFSHALVIALSELTPQSMADLLKLKWRALNGEGTPPSTLVEQLTMAAQGNPFYLEELLNYLHERGLLLDAKNWRAEGEPLALPDSLYSLLLSRMDQLAESQKIVMKVASIIGRVFRFAWLWGVHPDLGPSPEVHVDLNELTRLDFTLVDQPEPELVYLFRHALTQEVAYGSLAYTTRSTLHGQLAQFVETTYQDRLSQYLDLLAFHYERSLHEGKKREYLQKAGEAAQAAYANASAIRYYQRLLSLLSETEQPPIMLQLGEVFEVVGQWEEAQQLYQHALALGEQRGNVYLQARCQYGIGAMRWKQGEYAEALAWLTRAQGMFETLGEPSEVSLTLALMGRVYQQQGEYKRARVVLEEGLGRAREAQDRRGTAQLLYHLGLVAWRQSDYRRAQALYEQSLSEWRELGDRRSIVTVLNSLGIVTYNRGDYGRALTFFEESLAVRREIGDKQGIAASLNDLGLAAYDRGDYAAAQAYHTESLALRRDLGDRLGIVMALNNLGLVAYQQGDYDVAHTLFGDSLVLARELEDRWSTANGLTNLGLVAVAQGHYQAAQAYYEESLVLRQELGDQASLAESLEAIAGLWATQDQVQQATRLLGAADVIRKMINAPLEPTERARYDRILAVIQAALSQDALTAAWLEGQSMTLDQAVAYALTQDSQCNA